MGIYDFSNYGKNIFMAASLGLFKSTDDGSTFSLIPHNIGAINTAGIAMHGKDIYIVFTKNLGTLWFKSVDYGNSINLFDEQPGFIVFSTEVIGNKLFTGRSDGLWFRELIPSSIKDDNNAEKFLLSQNYLNPFNPATIIDYALEKNSRVTIKVHDVLGREVATLVDEEKPAGRYRVEFKAARLSSGVNYYQMKAGRHIKTKKMILLR